METWFLLFAGSSPDGCGRPAFVGRTTIIAIAWKHYDNCRKDPYSTGYVQIITADKYTVADANTDWDAL